MPALTALSRKLTRLIHEILGADNTINQQQLFMTRGPAVFFQLQSRPRVRYTSTADACYG